jgi:hypothetical protein
MRKDFYVEVPTLEAADTILNEIEQRMGEKWEHPNQNPFSSRTIFSWNTEHLSGCEDLIDGLPRLTLDEAMKKDYGIGFHQGKFSQASRKLEEARFLIPAIINARESINFSATRALFYAFQSSIYSTREALKKSCRKIGHEARDWWENKERSIKKSEPLLQRLHVDYNREKHGEASGLLKPVLMMYEYAGPLPDVISGEGIFTIIDRGTLRQRRVFHTGAVAKLSIELLVEKQILSGEDISNASIEQKLEMIVSYFENILWEARETFSDTPHVTWR